MRASIPVSFSLPEGFEYNEVKPNLEGISNPSPLPPLGDIAAFANTTFRGTGFNTIFRPQNPATPTPLPMPQPNSDNILELNLTTETLTFTQPLGNIPNRGSAQGDIFMNGIPYTQSISDVTTSGQSPAIHFEPGIWIAVPATTVPQVDIMTYARMASIPHGTTIEAQGISSGTLPGKPTIDPVNITPFAIGGTQPPSSTRPFASQTATAQGTPRIPQDLTSHIAAGTITQEILDDPNTVLRNHLAGQTIKDFIALEISTSPAAPLQPTFGGGTDNIAFLLGDAASPPALPNANATKMTAIFWIETVEETIVVPAHKPWGPPLIIKGAARSDSPTPVFSVKPPFEIKAPLKITVTYRQIQYTQTVFLVFKGLVWPHVSVATLIPLHPIEVPASVFPAGPSLPIAAPTGT